MIKSIKFTDVAHERTKRIIGLWFFKEKFSKLNKKNIIPSFFIAGTAAKWCFRFQIFLITILPIFPCLDPLPFCLSPILKDNHLIHRDFLKQNGATPIPIYCLGRLSQSNRRPIKAAIRKSVKRSDDDVGAAYFGKKYISFFCIQLENQRIVLDVCWRGGRIGLC